MGHSVEQQFDDTCSARLVPNERCVHSVHSLEVRLRIRIEDANPGGSPGAPEMNPEATLIGKRVANPMSTQTVFHHHDDSAAFIEISDRNAAPLPRVTADSLDDEGISAVVWRAWNTGKKREAGDRVGDAYNRRRKFHCLALRFASPSAIGRPGMNQKATDGR
jgi:hypothetical protein